MVVYVLYNLGWVVVTLGFWTRMLLMYPCHKSSLEYDPPVVDLIRTRSHAKLLSPPINDEQEEEKKILSLILASSLGARFCSSIQWVIRIDMFMFVV